ncbi:sensor histidine kinase [Pseudomonas sp. M47T1]|uniref:sensor histidine kinase n=1 Tax=unclassified Pseudomonas TaxID=196821 RepID=UPI0002606703|nr:HAMP domain-containing sensor histidine kinase [Pseudomonas sp. M47T1]EIK98226.1 sensor histidine kinase [Pseudomonas sp. M47T1]
MSDEQAGLDFSMVIASTVHDMKNSLASVMTAHGKWSESLPEAQRNTPERGVIDYEFANLNGMMVQLLGLYKLGVNQLPLRPEYHEMDDFIEAQLAWHQEVLGSRGITATCDVDVLCPLGFFDRELVGTVVANVIINAIRFARSSIHVSAGEENGQLVLSVNDDGPGYPPALIEAQSNYVQGINPVSGSTGLGLYFAARIAERHERNGVPGHVQLNNGGDLGGGLFKLYLP